MMRLSLFLESKSEVEEQIKTYINHLISISKTGTVSSLKDTRAAILNFLKREDDEFEQFIDPTDKYGIRYTSKGASMLKKFKKEHPEFDDRVEQFNLDSDTYREYCSKCERLFFDRLYSSIDKDLKTQDGKIQVERVIKIESDIEALYNQLDFYSERLGIYWSFYRGGAYSALDEVSSEPIFVRIKALVPIQSVSLYETKRALLNAGEEAEITIKTDAEVEVYEIDFEYRGKTVKRHKLKQHIICKA